MVSGARPVSPPCFHRSRMVSCETGLVCWRGGFAASVCAAHVMEARRREKAGRSIQSAYVINLALKLLRRDAFSPAHIRAQSLRNEHAAVLLLVVLEDSQPRASDCKSRAVERVHVLRFSLRVLESDVRASCLRRLKVRTRGNLAIQIQSRQPDFKIVRFRRREAHVCRT